MLASEVVEHAVRASKADGSKTEEDPFTVTCMPGFLATEEWHQLRYAG
jgi:hypothetical protein